MSKTFKDFLESCKEKKLEDSLENQDLKEKIEFQILVKTSDLERAKEELEAQEIVHEFGEEIDGFTEVSGRGKRDFKRIIAVVDKSGAEFKYPEEMKEE